MLLWIIKCRAIAGLLRPNLLFLVNSIKMSVRTPYSFTVGGGVIFLQVIKKGNLLVKGKQGGKSRLC